MLADRLKIGTVAETLARMSAEEYTEWKALFNVEGREQQHRGKVGRAKRPKR